MTISKLTSTCFSLVLSVSEIFEILYVKYIIYLLLFQSQIPYFIIFFLFIMTETMASGNGIDTTEITKPILEKLILQDINQDLQIVNSEEINPTESTNEHL